MHVIYAHIIYTTQYIISRINIILCVFVTFHLCAKEARPGFGEGAGCAPSVDEIGTPALGWIKKLSNKAGRCDRRHSINLFRNQAWRMPFLSVHTSSINLKIAEDSFTDPVHFRPRGYRLVQIQVLLVFRVYYVFLSNLI